MKIILDDRTLSESPETLSEAINVAADRAASMGRVVVDIFADGRAVSADEFDDAAAMSHPCDEVRLTTAEPRAFVRVTMLDAADALEHARVEQRRAAELIEAGSLPEAYVAIEGALQLWQSARQALDQGAQLVGLDLATVPLDSPNGMGEAIANLAAGLEEVRRSVSSQDWAALSDALLYDLDEQVPVWRDLLGRVAAHLESGGTE